MNTCLLVFYNLLNNFSKALFDNTTIIPTRHNYIQRKLIPSKETFENKTYSCKFSTVCELSTMTNPYPQK